MTKRLSTTHWSSPRALASSGGKSEFLATSALVAIEHGLTSCSMVSPRRDISSITSSRCSSFVGFSVEGGGLFFFGWTGFVFLMMSSFLSSMSDGGER